MAYVDLGTIHEPAPDEAPPAEWGGQTRDNFEALANPPRCKLTRNSPQSLPNSTATIVLFNDEVYDVGGLHSTSSNTGRVTVPAGWAGLWEFKFTGMYDSNATTGIRGFRIRKNGSFLLVNVDVNATASGGTSQAIAVEEEMAEGDYVEVELRQSSGATVDLLQNSYSPIFTARWVGVAAP